jgi:hypothetical protein
VPRSPVPHHRRVRRAGWAILVVGWIAAAAVYLGAGDPPGDGLDDRAHQREMQQLERLGGQASVQTARLDAWLSSLWQGRRLAGTLAVLSLLAAAGCAWIAGLMAEDVDD